MSEPLKLIVLSGGLGTRIRSSIQGRPKALAPIRGSTFIEFLLEDWVRKGITDFLLLLGHKGHDIEEVLLKSTKVQSLNIKLDFLHEESLLGTGGAVVNAIHEKSLQGKFLVINSDTWITDNHKDLIKTESPSIAIIEVEDTSRFGEVLLDKNNYVIDFLEKNGEKKRGFINSGLYLLDDSLFHRWSKGEVLSMEKDCFPEFIKSRELSACTIQGNFIDIGVPEDYNYFKNNLEDFRS